MNTKGVEDGMADERRWPECIRYESTTGEIFNVRLVNKPNNKIVYTRGDVDLNGVFTVTLDEWLSDIADARSKLPKPAEDGIAIRPATNEELIEQGQNLAKNYKPGPRQAVPFMPTAVPVEERTSEITWVPVYVERAICDLIPDTGYAREIARVGWAWDDEHPGHENALNRWKNEAIRQRRDLIALQELLEHEQNPVEEGFSDGPDEDTHPELHCEPVPEERTSEMEQLLKSYRENCFCDMPGLCRDCTKYDQLHIEGKAKAESPIHNGGTMSAMEIKESPLKTLAKLLEGVAIPVITCPDCHQRLSCCEHVCPVRPDPWQWQSAAPPEFKPVSGRDDE